MPTSAFINLPVDYLPKSVAFYETLGYSIDQNFSDEKSACVVISDTLYLMLLTKPYFKTYISTDVADATKVTEAMIGLSADDRQAVDALVDTALAAGASQAAEPRDLGFMYSRSFLDPDGHYWDIFWIDPKVAEQGPPSAK